MAEENVPVTISPATTERLLPFSFLETQLYERMSQLLEGYLPTADIRYMLSEIKGDLFKGFTSMDVQQLHTVIHHCKKCPAMGSKPILPSWNCTDPDLMIIVENPVAIDRYGQILFDALKKAGFSSQRCMLTHAVRCKTFEPTQQNVDSCVPYLHTELAIVNPKLVLTLGLTSFRYLTGDKLSKINEIKGVIKSWGMYSILPEVSLGTLYHANEKGQGAHDGFELSLEKAHSYLYSGG